MLSDVWDLVSQWTWVWWLTTVLLWGLVGAVVADWAGHRRLPAAVVSALLPIIGLAVLLLVWFGARTARPARAGAAAALGGSSAVEDEDAWCEPARASSTRAAAPPARSPAALWDSEDDDVGDWPPVTGRARPVRPRRADDQDGLIRTCLLVTGLATAALALVALLVGWFAVRPADNVLGNYKGNSTALTAVPLVITAVCLTAAALLYYRRPRRTWAILVAFVAAPCLAIGAQILVAAHPLSSAAYRIVEKAGAPAALSVRISVGTFVLLMAGILGMGWAYAAAYWTSTARGARGGKTSAVGTRGGVG